MKVQVSSGALAVCILLLTACGGRDSNSGAESPVEESFDQWIEQQGVAYRDIEIETVSESDAFATIRITVEIRADDESDWVEYQQEVRVPKQGDGWGSPSAFDLSPSAQAIQTIQAQENQTATEESVKLGATHAAFERDQTATSEAQDATATVRSADEQATQGARAEIEAATATAEAEIAAFTATARTEAENAQATADTENQLAQLYSDMERTAAQGDWKAAFDYADRIIEIDLNYQDVQGKRTGYINQVLDVARGFADQGDWPQTVDALAEIISVDQDNATAKELIATAQQRAEDGPPPGVYPVGKEFPHVWVEDFHATLESLEILADGSFKAAVQLHNRTGNEMRIECWDPPYLSFGEAFDDVMEVYPRGNFYCPEIYDNVWVAPDETVQVWVGFAPIDDATRPLNVHLENNNSIRSIYLWDLWRVSQG